MSKVKVRKRAPGGGRKPTHGVAGVSHLARPTITAKTPVRVTLRLSPGIELPSGALAEACAACNDPPDFRVKQFAAEGSELHLTVEARDRQALSRGMQGFSVRLARGLNRVLGRSGRVFADRYSVELVGS